MAELDDGFVMLESRYRAVCQELHDVTAKRNELALKLARSAEVHEAQSAAYQVVNDQLNEARSRLDSERLDRTREHNTVAEKLFATERELDATRSRLEDAESRLNGIKALRVEMVDHIGADLDATLQGLLWPKDIHAEWCALKIGDPAAGKSCDCAVERQSDFEVLDPPTREHDMARGPCKCGAWHDKSPV